MRGDGLETPGCEIAILNPNRYPEAAVRRVRPWLETVLAEVAPKATSFGVRFSGDRELRRANREYRGKDYATDVLSFPSDEGDGHLGDVLISVPRARHQAEEAGHDADREVEILLLHGILHCLGHDHETDDGAMERLERRLRKKFLSSPPR